MKRIAFWGSTIFLLVLVLVGCAREVPSAFEQQDVNSTQVVSPVEDSGYLYLRLGNVDDQFYHYFVRVPAACLADQTACDAVEVISTYPEGGIGQNHLHWSPDQSRAVLLDTYNDCLHIFDPQTKTFSVLLEEAMVANDDLVWLFSGELVYVRQSADQTSTLVSLTWEDADLQIAEVVQFEGMAHLLGEDLEGGLYFAEDIDDHPAEDASLKIQTVDTNILQVNPQTGESEELWSEEDWLTLRPQVVTSDGRWLVYGDNMVSIWDIQTGETALIGEGVLWPTPSPDGRWLVVIFHEDDLYNIRLLNLETMTWEAVVSLRSVPFTYWSPNSRYIVLARYYEPDLVPGSLIVIEPETGGIFNPKIDLQGYQWVDDVSWGR